MSQLTHPISVREQLRSHWMLALSALFAVAATAAVVLVLAIDGGSSATSTAVNQPQPALRSDGGPDESAVAVSVGSRLSSAPNESSIAAAVGGSARSTGGYWESVDPRSSYEPASAEGVGQHAGGPDETRIAATISGR